jgi:hypothetical protein
MRKPKPGQDLTKPINALPDVECSRDNLQFLKPTSPSSVRNVFPLFWVAIASMRQEVAAKKVAFGQHVRQALNWRQIEVAITIDHANFGAAIWKFVTTVLSGLPRSHAV